MKPKIAVLENGKFAIQTSRFPKAFLDLRSTKHTWSPGDTYFNDCLGDLETCREKLKAISLKVVGYVE